VVGIAHAADESILCMRGSDMAFPKLLWDFLFIILSTAVYDAFIKLTETKTVIAVVPENQPAM